MAKRVLSLLLALVMALSLCVPAFAAEAPVDEADEVGAEAVEEVVDEAAAEPEAEPVDEPAEVAVDEPETAAVDEPETVAVDEPMLVTLGVVTKEAHWQLYKAVEAAEKLLPGVQAGTLRSADFDLDEELKSVDLKDYAEGKVDLFAKATGDKDAKEDFESVLAEAQEYLTGIDGTEVDLDVTDTNVKAAAAALEKFLPTGDHALVDTILTEAKGEMTYLKVSGLKDLLEEKGDANCGSHDEETATLEISADMDPVTSDPNFKKTYQADYLTKLQAAIDAYLSMAATKTPVKYADFVKLTKTILDTLVLEEQASKPNAADMTRVNAAIAKVPAEKNYKPADYVLHYEWDEKISTDAGDGLLDEVKDLKADAAAATSEFDSSKSLWDVNDAITALENAMIKVGNPTIKFVEGVGAAENTDGATVTFSVTNVAGSDGSVSNAMDGYEYGIAWRVKSGEEEKWYDPDAPETGIDYEAGDAAPVDIIKALINGFDTSGCKQWTKDPVTKVWEASGAVKPIGAAMSSSFKEKDVVTLHIFKNTGTTTRPVWTQIKTFNFTIGPKEVEDTVDWPTKITDVTYTVGSGKVTAFVPTTDKLVGAGNYAASKTSKVTGFAETDEKLKVVLDAKFEGSTAKDTNDVWFVIKDAKGKVVFTSAKVEADIEQAAGYTLTIPTDTVLEAGKYTVEMRSCKNGKMDEGVYDVRVSKTFKVDPISAWTEAANIETVLAAAEALVDSDYKVEDHDDDLNATTDEGKLAEVFALIQKNVDGIRAVLNSTTAGNTTKNHNKAVDAKEKNATCLDKLLTVIGYLTKKDANEDEMKQLLNQALNEVGDPATENEGTGKYTFDSRGRLQDAIEKAQKLNDPKADLQSDVDAAVAALKAALAGLVELADIDKSELEAAIAAAEALNEEDYTPESWADLEDAIEAAKNVLADEDATQAQLTNAADKLNKAVAALVKDVDADDLAAAIEAAEAAIADPSKYTDESVKAVQDAITAAKALGDDATADEIADAIEALESAVKGLTEAATEPEIPEAPTGGTGWVQAEDGTYYYYKNDAVVKGDWVKSKGLWYHMGADGTMDTGFIHIVDDWGDGWYYLEPSNAKGTEGRMRTGWQEINDATAGHWGWFETRSNGHQGQCTYTSAWGDFDGYTKK